MALRKNNPVEPTPAAATDTEKDVPLATDTPTRTTRLRKPSPSAAPAAAAPVEEPVVAQEPEMLDPEPGAQAEAAAAPAEKAVAARPAARPPAMGGGLGLVSPFSSLENQIAPGQLAFGSIPRYTASNGQIIDGDKKTVGTWLQFEPVSFNNLYMMAPGSNDDDAKEFLKFSHDGEICNDGSMTLQEALKTAQANGYKDAAIKKYVEVFGILLGAEKIADGSPALSKLIMLSLSPESVKAWEGFKVQAAVQIKLGKMSADDLRVVTAGAVVKNYGSTTFTCFNFE